MSRFIVLNTTIGELAVLASDVRRVVSASPQDKAQHPDANSVVAYTGYPPSLGEQPPLCTSLVTNTVQQIVDEVNSILASG